MHRVQLMQTIVARIDVSYCFTISFWHAGNTFVSDKNTKPPFQKKELFEQCL